MTSTTKAVLECNLSNDEISQIFVDHREEFQVQASTSPTSQVFLGRVRELFVTPDGRRLNTYYVERYSRQLYNRIHGLE